MKLRLGYAVKNLTLELNQFRTITYTRYKSLDKDTAIKVMDEIVTHNLNTLLTVIDYNYKHKIFFYRLTDDILPLATIPNINYDYFNKHHKLWQKIAAKIQKYGMRIDSHPSQYCLLNSEKEQVYENSLVILELNYQIFQHLNIEGQIILHVGCGKNNKEYYKELFIQNFLKLPEHIKKLITLENDDLIYNSLDTLLICEKLHIPMTLDYHHHQINTSIKIQDLLPRILNTWQNHKLPPKMHFSSPKNSHEKRSHHFYISYHAFLRFLNILKFYNTDIDIMLECKGKDEALLKLFRQIKFYYPHLIKNNTIYLS